MDPKLTGLEAEIVALRAEVARSNVELRTLQHEVRAAKAELSYVSWRMRLLNQVDYFPAAVVTLIVITFVLFAALWRGLGWI